MGNNRQQLRDKLEADLKKQIAAATATLTTCKIEQANVDHNLTDAKLEVQTNFASLTQTLSLRKLELIRQIDLLGQAQANSLQEHIQSTYLLLGSLQSTLSNLDSFEHGQLLNLQIPDDKLIKNLPLPSPLKANAECEKLIEDISAWGSVVATGRQGSVDVGTSASTSFVEDFVIMSHESVNPAMDELSAIREYIKLPPTNPAAEPIGLVNKDNFSQTSQNPTNGFSNSGQWYFEQWLDQVKDEPRAENDDFEMLSIEPESESEVIFEQPVLSPSSEDCIVPDVEILAETTDEDEKTSEVSTDELDEKESELSKWLKPRKRQSTPSVSSSSSILGMIQHEIPETRKVSKVATKNRFFEYPGLRLDPNCWLHRGNSKGLEDLFNASDVSLTLNQKEIIPPTYALPYPFWLKKC